MLVCLTSCYVLSTFISFQPTVVCLIARVLLVTLTASVLLQFLHFMITSAFYALLCDNLLSISILLESHARLEHTGHGYSVI